MAQTTAVLSDIHGNAAALDAVLRDLDRTQPDRVAVLGDLAYRGAEPKRSLELVRSLGATVIGGNADLWVLREIQRGEVPDRALTRMNRERDFTRAHIDDADLDYLSALPDTATLGLGSGLDLFLCHATPDSRFEIVLPDESNERLAALYLSGATRPSSAQGPHKISPSQPPAAAAFGHVHLAFARFLRGSLVFNPGSVGMPFDGLPKASYALIEVADSATLTISVRRVAYEVASATEALYRVDYPEADRIAQSLVRAELPAVD